tara:strand:+ start:616 stop:777 length:162 start_codon:yes stop_codon:yes gene_type:complete
MEIKQIDQDMKYRPINQTPRQRHTMSLRAIEIIIAVLVTVLVVGVITLFAGEM